MLSVTISPRNKEVLDTWAVQLYNNFDGNCVISFETGRNNNLHLQCCFETDQRTNNFRRFINRICEYNPEDDAERKYWLKVKKSNNPQYTVGYCMKENNVQYVRMPNIEQCIEYYTKMKAKIGASKKESEYVCTGINSFLQAAFEFCCENDLAPSMYDIRTIAAIMVGKKLIPTSLGMKFTRRHNDFWVAFIGELEEQEIYLVIDNVRREYESYN